MRRLVAEGAPGARIPSVRDLARRHAVSPVTVQRLLATLEREGLVEPRPGRGTFITPRRQPRRGDWSWQTVNLGTRPLPGQGMAALIEPPPAGSISFATGYPDPSLQPLGILANAGSRASRRPDSWSRSPIEGLPALRSWFAADIGAGVQAEDVLVIAGGQAALSAAFRSLASPGEPVIVESPTYVGAIDAARLAGLALVPVPSDEHGMRPDLLEAALGATRAQLIYIQANLANPTAVTTTLDRRHAILEAARTAGAFVIEDDYARDLYYDGTINPGLLHDDVDGHVAYVRSLTKSVAPAMRLAAMVARGPARQRLRNARLVDDFFVSAILQETALDVVASPRWPRHLDALRRGLSTRMDALINEIASLPNAQLTVRPRGGLVAWLRLDDSTDETQLAERARQLGVIVTTGRTWFASEPPGVFLRLSIAATDLAHIAEGMHRLRTALDGAPHSAP